MMPLCQAPPDIFLPEIDAPLEADALASAHQLIEAELAAAAPTPPPTADTLHPSLAATTPAPPNFSPLISDAHQQLAATGKIAWQLDLSRYELAPLPSPSNAQDPSAAAAAKTRALNHASASAEYLAQRHANLSLLEAYGKNAWLVGNARLEDELRAVERELEGSRAELETLQLELRARRDAARGEMLGLEEGWRTGVGRMIEVLAAGERVRAEVLEGKRVAAGG